MKNTFVFICMIIVVASSMTCCYNDKESDVQELAMPPQDEQEDVNSSKDDSAMVYMLPVTKSVNLSNEQRAKVERINEFSFKFYCELTNDSLYGGRSNIVSPPGLSFVLTMLLNGAMGQTAAEITDVLGLDGDLKSDNELFRILIDELPVVDDAVSLKIANMVAFDEKVELEEMFRQNMTAYFSATTPQLQFENVHTSTDFINDWCSKQTEGMIPHIVNEQEISGNTLLAVLNAISFKATWTDKFDPRNTYEEDFLTGSEVCRTPMMHQRIEARYASNEMYSMVELPFGSGDKWSMKVLLPHEGMGIADIISRLCPSVWLADCQQLRPHIVDLAFPRYKTVTELELNGIVSRMGAETMFQPATADFSLLTRNYKKAGSNCLFVSLLKQMSAAEVSEEGTQLAASSIADVVLGAQPVSEHAEFFANRPFVYVVEEASSGIIFFIGTFSGK